MNALMTASMGGAFSASGHHPRFYHANRVDRRSLQLHHRPDLPLRDLRSPAGTGLETGNTVSEIKTTISHAKSANLPTRQLREAVLTRRFYSELWLPQVSLFETWIKQQSTVGLFYSLFPVPCSLFPYSLLPIP